jgi:hypothetical protein
VSDDLICFVDFDGELHARVPFEAENGSVPVLLNWSLGVDCGRRKSDRRLAFAAGEEEEWATADSWACETGKEIEEDDDEEDWANFD